MTLAAGDLTPFFHLVNRLLSEIHIYNKNSICIFDSVKNCLQFFHKEQNTETNTQHLHHVF